MQTGEALSKKGLAAVNFTYLRVTGHHVINSRSPFLLKQHVWVLTFPTTPGQSCEQTSVPCRQHPGVWSIGAQVTSVPFFPVLLCTTLFSQAL